ncbi:MAG: hypothetical protein WKF87_09240 [Chryseolinea sp.]
MSFGRSFLFVSILFWSFDMPAQHRSLPKNYQGHHTRPIGYTDLNGKPGFKMAIKEHQGRWYLYVAHFWHQGWSVVDVTNPDQPQVVKFIPGPDNTATWQIDISGDRMITGLEHRTKFPNFGGDSTRHQPEGVIIWDISNPLEPRQLGTFKTQGTGTHRNFYGGGDYMHLAAGMPGYTGNIYIVVNISDSSNPVEAGRWWVKEQKGGTDKELSLHGPPFVVENTAYLPYGSAGLIILDISDLKNIREIGRLDFSPPFHGQLGVHGVVPVPDKGIAYVNSEDISYGKGPLHFAAILDIINPSKPILLSLFPEPVPPSGSPYKNFREKGGWTGPHNMNQLQHNPSIQKQDSIFYLAHFNAGLRIYDVSDKRLPKEIGWFLPPEPKHRYGPMPAGKLVMQTEDVLVDKRGYIYLTDKNQGLWIVQHTP